MSWFPFFRKSKPESAAGGDEFYSRAEQESTAARGRAKRSGSNGNAAKREPADPVLPEKKRARRRLVGAVALVLALVIGLPMILDSEPKPLAEDISIQIPSKNKAPAPADMPAQPAAAPAKPNGLDAAEEIVEPPAVKPASVASAAPPAAREEVSAPVTAKSIEKPAPTVPAPQVALAKPAAKPENKPDAHAAPHAPAVPRVDEAARAKAILEGKFDAPAAVAKPGKFVVQVAALASADKVNELRGKLTQAGIASYTQKVATASGERIRIRVGPFASKDEAEQMRARLGKLGLSGTLVPA